MRRLLGNICVAELDIDNDGMLSAAEFAKMAQSRYANGLQINPPGTSPICTNRGLPPKISHSLHDGVTR